MLADKLTYEAAAAVGLCTFAAAHLYGRYRRDRKYPPGPQGIPFIGNLLDMPESREWVTYQKWAETYGDIIFVRSLGSPTLILNRYEDAVELLEKRGASYSSRPRFVMVNELQGWKYMIAWSRNNEHVRKGREAMLHFLRPSVIPRYEGMLVKETHKMLNNILTTPGSFQRHIRNAFGSIIMLFTYGHQVQGSEDRFIDLAERGIHELSAFGKTFLVDIFPSLRHFPSWLPGMRFKTKAKDTNEIATAMRVETYELVKTALREGDAAPSMASGLIEMNTDDTGITHNEEPISGYLANIYGAGTDTVASVVVTFVIAMALYPDVQRRAFQELETVIGKDNLPRFEDRNRLPYIAAIYQECLRWQPVTPIAVPHSTTADDHYKGFFIPAGTTIVPNVWSMLQDEDVYPQPSEFIPERWLTETGKTPPTPAEKMAFGFGRRLCVGKHFADASAFIAIASILATFAIDTAKKFGKPSAEYFEGFVRVPLPFECNITPRSSKLATIVRELVDGK